MHARGVVSHALTIAGVLLLAAVGRIAAVEPGVDIAVPRVAIVGVYNTTSFDPPLRVIEQGDHVRWQTSPGTGLSHTTTSGSVCGATTGLWDAPLNSVSPSFTRQFNEAPGNIPYYCRPHCLSNMRGTVQVTTEIQVTATDNGSLLTLTWTGGSGSYQVFRSEFPAFTNTEDPPLPPDGGAAGTTFTDPLQPATNSATFYLVMNK